MLRKKQRRREGGKDMSQLAEKAIKEAFIGLLTERPLDRIRIRDITDRCGISRNTFYYHYADIPTLLSSIFMEEAEKIILNREEPIPWEDGFLSAAQFALENKKPIYHIYHSVARENLERYLNYVGGIVMEQYVERAAQGMDIAAEDKKLIEDFYRAALVGMTLDWLESGMKYDPERYIRRIGSMLKGNIELVLERVQR